MRDWAAPPPSPQSHWSRNLSRSSSSAALVVASGSRMSSRRGGVGRLRVTRRHTGTRRKDGNGLFLPAELGNLGRLGLLCARGVGSRAVGRSVTARSPPVRDVLAASLVQSSAGQSRHHGRNFGGRRWEGQVPGHMVSPFVVAALWAGIYIYLSTSCEVISGEKIGPLGMRRCELAPMRGGQLVVDKRKRENGEAGTLVSILSRRWLLRARLSSSG